MGGKSSKSPYHQPPEATPSLSDDETYRTPQAIPLSYAQENNRLRVRYLIKLGVSNAEKEAERYSKPPIRL